MPLKFCCDCGCRIAVPQNFAGRSIRCPQCKQRVTVPAVAESAGNKGYVPLSTFLDIRPPQPPPVLSSSPTPPAAELRPDEPEPETASATAPLTEDSQEAGRSEVPLEGYQPDVGKLATVRWLAAGWVVTLLVGLTPAALELAQLFRSNSFGPLPRWTCFLLLLAVVQFAYIVYLVQLPDWSSTWVVTILTMLLATGYALMLGIALLAPERNPFVELLDLAGRLEDRRVAGWCLIMLCLTGLWSYSSGRFSIRWFEQTQR